MSQSQSSLSRRFITVLMSVVIVLVALFAAIAISVNISRVETQLAQRLEDAATLAARGLSAPLWNLDEGTITGILKAALASEAIAYVRVESEDGNVSQQVLPALHNRDLDFFEQSRRFLVTRLDILRDAEKLGTLHLAISRQSVRREVRLNVIGIVVLTVLLLAAIILTSMIITRRYIARPLGQLQQSAALIAGGDLHVPIDTERQDEIGQLAAGVQYHARLDSAAHWGVT